MAGQVSERGSHTGDLSVSRSFLARLMTAVGHGLQQVRRVRSLDAVELAVGFEGSMVSPVLISATESGVTIRNTEDTFDALREQGSWEELSEGASEGEIVPPALIRGGTLDHEVGPLGLEADEANQLSRAVQAAREDHCYAAVADVPLDWAPFGEVRVARSKQPRSSKAWLYDLMLHLPALVGVDHSAALILPDHGRAAMLGRRYIVAAELHYVLDGEQAPTLLVGLSIPTTGGLGGLVEGTIDTHATSRRRPYYVFESTAEGHWREESVDDEPRTFAPLVRTADRPERGMLVLLPLHLPNSGPGFLALNFRRVGVLSAAARALFEMLSVLLSEALARSDLYRLPLERLRLFDSFAPLCDGEPCRSRVELVGRLSTELYASLGAASVAIGLIDDGDPDDPRLVFVEPQGWDLDLPRVSHYLTSDSLAALALRLQRPIVLAGGRQVHPGAPALRFNNSLYINEKTGEIADARLVRDDGVDLEAAVDWRPLADYYKPTTPMPVYAGVAIPLTMGSRQIGVLVMDFERQAPWDTYSGFGTEALYTALANLLTSHLALLPEEPIAS